MALFSCLEIKTGGVTKLESKEKDVKRVDNVNRSENIAQV